MHIVITIGLGTILTIVVVVWILLSVWAHSRRQKQLALRRLAQEEARLKAVERSLRPPLRSRLLARWRKGEGEEP